MTNSTAPADILSLLTETDAMLEDLSVSGPDLAAVATTSCPRVYRFIAACRTLIPKLRAAIRRLLISLDVAGAQAKYWESKANDVCKERDDALASLASHIATWDPDGWRAQANEVRAKVEQLAKAYRIESEVNKRLSTEVERLRTTLVWYADERNYLIFTYPSAGYEFDREEGQRARDALEIKSPHLNAENQP